MADSGQADRLSNVWGLIERLLRRLNRFRASSNERRLYRELRTAYRKLDEVRAEAERRTVEAEAMAADATRRAEVAEIRADVAELERAQMVQAVERMRVHYAADIAEAAKRMAEAT